VAVRRIKLRIVDTAALHDGRGEIQMMGVKWKRINQSYRLTPAAELQRKRKKQRKSNILFHHDPRVHRRSLMFITQVYGLPGWCILSHLQDETKYTNPIKLMGLETWCISYYAPRLQHHVKSVPRVDPNEHPPSRQVSI
jgi:hypothetical protein